MDSREGGYQEGRIPMATEAQIIANRRNSQKSTGPRSPEGKAVVSKNAVKHGLFASENVIKGEKKEDFDLFHDEMLSKFHPHPKGMRLPPRQQRKI